MLVALPGNGWHGRATCRHRPRDAENEAVAVLLGPFLVLTFCLSQALRDVYFGHVFQQVDFFAVILVAFTLSTLVFAPSP